MSRPSTPPDGHDATDGVTAVSKPRQLPAPPRLRHADAPGAAPTTNSLHKPSGGGRRRVEGPCSPPVKPPTGRMSRCARVSAAVCPEPSPDPRHQVWPLVYRAAIVVIIVVSSSLALWRSGVRVENDTIHDAFTAQAAATTRMATAGVRQSLAALRLTAVAMGRSAPGDLSASAFARFAAADAAARPGATTHQWMPRVQPQHRSDVEAVARQAYAGDAATPSPPLRAHGVQLLQVNSSDATGASPVPADGRVLWPVLYQHVWLPQDVVAASSALMVDVASMEGGGAVVDACEAAIRQGHCRLKPAAFASVEWAALCPVYQPHVHDPLAATPQQRDDAAVGCVTRAIRVDTAFLSLLLGGSSPTVAPDNAFADVVVHVSVPGMLSFGAGVDSLASVATHVVSSQEADVAAAAAPLGLSFSATVALSPSDTAVLRVIALARFEQRRRLYDNLRTVVATSLAALVAVSVGLFLVSLWEKRLTGEHVDKVLEEHRSRLARADTAQATHERTLSYVCHELRNPLHVISAALSFAREQVTDTSPVLQDLRCASEAAQQLHRLVNDVLDLRKLKAGHLSIRPEPVVLSECLKPTVQSHVAMCEAAVSLSLEVGSNVPHRLLLDPLRLRQLVSNGLTNAIKCTERGSIVVKATLLASARNMLLFEIQDTGHGLGDVDGAQLLHEFGTQVPASDDGEDAPPTPSAAWSSAASGSASSSSSSLAAAASVPPLTGGVASVLVAHRTTQPARGSPLAPRKDVTPPLLPSAPAGEPPVMSLSDTATRHRRVGSGGSAGIADGVRRRRSSPAAAPASDAGGGGARRRGRSGAVPPRSPEGSEGKPASGVDLASIDAELYGINAGAGAGASGGGGAGGAAAGGGGHDRGAGAATPPPSDDAPVAQWFFDVEVRPPAEPAPVDDRQQPTDSSFKEDGDSPPAPASRRLGLVTRPRTNTGSSDVGSRQSSGFGVEEVADEAARAKQGTGLGLSVCQQLVTRMGGQLGLCNRVDGVTGAVFWFTIPFEPAPPTASEATPAGARRLDGTPAAALRRTRFQGVRVLVVDDHQVNLRMVSRMLKRLGCVVAQAATGREALTTLAQSRAQGGHVDLVLCDVNMPDLSGPEVVRTAKRKLQFKSMPFVAMTAAVQPHEIERYHAAGFEPIVLSKPFDTKSVSAVLRKVLHKGT